MRRYVAEAVGTFGVIFAGCGAAIVGGPRLGDTGVALAFGLALAAMTLILAPISGAHLNPAVTAASVLLGRLRAREAAPYVGAQLAGGVLGAAAVTAIAAGRAGSAPLAAETLANGYGRLSPGAYGISGAFVAEVSLTAILVLVLLSVSDAHPKGGLSAEAALAHRGTHAVTAAAAGVAYTLIHLVGMPVTKLAANPARALGPALLARGDSLVQLWLFFVAPVLGALVAAGLYRALWAPARAKPLTLVAAGTLPYRQNMRPPVAQALDEDDDDAGPSTLRSPRPGRVEPTQI